MLVNTRVQHRNRDALPTLNLPDIFSAQPI